MMPTLIPDWLLPTILLIPALLWMFLGVGIPWALALLPRSDWYDRVSVIAVALALGPAFTTTAMFIIGTLGRFTLANVLAASAITAGIGLSLAARNRSGGPSTTLSRCPLTLIDMLLIALVALAVVLRFWNAAYWPYTTYDEFWVYGYNAKIFMLRGMIPSSIGYYPQLLPLAYTFGQLMWGSVNDHAARTVVPIFALGSALMAYVMGTRLFNRRVGLLTAAIWMLYPHNAAWSQFGDLEVPVTLYFTGTAAFFILGWRERNRRYVVLSGVLMGAALWTKPTAGALIESIGLVLAALGIQSLAGLSRPSITAFLKPSTVRYPLLALAVAVPMGGMWYIRNVLYGHPPLVFPEGYWQLQAQRSGQELGWLVLIAAAVALALVTRRQHAGTAIGGLALFAVGSLPSAFGWRLPTLDELSRLLRGDLPSSLTPTHLTFIEALVIFLGVALLAWSALPIWRKLPACACATLLLIGAFIFPYFVTWFWSYSYHFRLSFAIVPLLIVLLAAVLDSLLQLWLSDRVITHQLRMVATSIIILALAVPGLLAMLIALEPAFTGSLPNDHDKIARGNMALMGLVDYLTDRHDPNRRPAYLDRPMRVEAPGELRLPFFFPLDDIRTERYPTLLDQIADVDFFVDSSVGQRLYRERGKEYNQILSSLTRENVMQWLYSVDDKNFRFTVYDVDDQSRFKNVDSGWPINAKFGDFAVLLGYTNSRDDNFSGESVSFTFWWKAIKPADLDYSVYFHMWDPRRQVLVGNWTYEPVMGAWSFWQRVPGAHFDIPYHTRLWQPGEIILDERRIRVPNAPPGVYELHIGLYDPASGQRLPATQNGKVLGDYVRLRDFTIRSK